MGLSRLSLQSFQFQLRDVHGERYEQDWHHSLPGTIYAHLDFKEHDTLPQGPCLPYFWYVLTVLGVFIVVAGCPAAPPRRRAQSC